MQGRGPKRTGEDYTYRIKGLSLLAAIIAGGYFAYHFFDVGEWKETTGRVVDTSVKEKQTNGRRHSGPYEAYFYIKYLYLVNKVSYTGEYKIKTFSFLEDARDYQQARIWKKQNVTVRYNPTFPSLSTLSGNGFQLSPGQY